MRETWIRKSWNRDQDNAENFDERKAKERQRRRNGQICTRVGGLGRERPVIREIASDIKVSPMTSSLEQ